MVALTKQVSLNDDEYKENATYIWGKKKKSADISFYRLPHNLHTLFSHLNVSIGSKPTLPPDLIQIDQPMWQPCVQLDTIICIFPLGIIKVFWL